MLSLADCRKAQDNVYRVARRTSLRSQPLLTQLFGSPVFTKMEVEQETGSFKVRGATNKLMNLDPEVAKKGVVAVSTGNHGRAVAFVGRQLGVPVTVCLSELVPKNKVDAIRELGAQLVIKGKSQDEAFESAEALGLPLIHPFDDLDVIAGQSTIGLEIMEQLPNVGTVVVPLSGGGLISGIALAVKSLNPKVHVVGVSMKKGAAMHASLKAGRPVLVEEVESLADSLQGGVGLENRYTFELCRRYVDDVILIDEETIAEAIDFAKRELGITLEGAGAVGIGALLRRRLDRSKGPVAIILTGCNADEPS